MSYLTTPWGRFMILPETREEMAQALVEKQHRIDVLTNYLERIRDIATGHVFSLAVEALENKP